MAIVVGNMQGYSKRQVKNTKRARDMLRVVGCPTTNEFKTMIGDCMLRNCLVTVEDINRAVELFGIDVPSLKRKHDKQKRESIAHYFGH